MSTQTPFANGFYEGRRTPAASIIIHKPQRRERARLNHDQECHHVQPTHCAIAVFGSKLAQNPNPESHTPLPIHFNKPMHGPRTTLYKVVAKLRSCTASHVHISRDVVVRGMRVCLCLLHDCDL